MKIVKFRWHNSKILVLHYNYSMPGIQTNYAWNVTALEQHLNMFHLYDRTDNHKMPHCHRRFGNAIHAWGPCDATHPGWPRLQWVWSHRCLCNMRMLLVLPKLGESNWINYATVCNTMDLTGKYAFIWQYSGFKWVPALMTTSYGAGIRAYRPRCHSRTYCWIYCTSRLECNHWSSYAQLAGDCSSFIQFSVC